MDELQSRREFFKNAAGKIIPLLAIMSSPSQVLLSCSKFDDGQENGGNGNEKYEKDGISAATGTIGGYGYVDLGLSVKWATCNLGAKTPEEDGNYYRFSTTDSYNELLSAGIKKGDSIANSVFDHVTRKLKSPWVTPTLAQYNELFENCSYKKYVFNGVTGIKFTSKINGKSIFLPGAGCYYDFIGKYELVGKEKGEGDYWLSDIMEHDIFFGRCFLWNSEFRLESRHDDVDSKKSIRPVAVENGSNSCGNSCSSSCSGSSTNTGCSSCASSCSSSCRTACEYNCAATCISHCYGSCNDTCGGGCSYLSAGSKCSGCATTCNGRCYRACSYACSSNCQSSCVGGSK